MNVNTLVLYVLGVGVFLISIFISLVIAIPSNNSLEKKQTQSDFLEKKANQIKELEQVNANSSDFNYKYSKYLNSDLNSAIQAKKNLLISKDGSIKGINTTYQGITWNYTTINEDNSYFYNLWKDNYLLSQYANGFSNNEFPYVATSSLAGGKRCYYEVGDKNKVCNDLPKDNSLQYVIRDVNTTYPINWTMIDLMQEHKVKNYIKENSVHSQILTNKNNEYPYVFEWGDKKPYTEEVSRVSSGNHLTYYLGKKLLNVTLSFKAQFYGYLLIKETNDSPFKKIAQSNGELISIDISVPSLVAIRLIAPPNLDRLRGKLFSDFSSDKIITKSLFKQFEKVDNYNKLFLYYLTISTNQQVMKAIKVNTTSIAFNRLLLDGKDIDYGIRMGVYQQLKDIYYNLLAEIGFKGYDLAFTITKDSKYSMSAFKHFREGVLNERNRKVIEFVPMGHFATKRRFNNWIATPMIPLIKPFGWIKNNEFKLAKSSKEQDFSKDLLLIYKQIYKSPDYDIYRNPPIIDSQNIYNVVVNFVLNRILIASELQFESHFVSMFLDIYSDKIQSLNDKLNYMKLAKIFSRLFFKSLTIDKNLQVYSPVDDSYYDSYYKHIYKDEIFNDYPIANLGVEFIKTTQGEVTSKNKILQKRELNLQSGYNKVVKNGWYLNSLKKTKKIDPNGFIHNLVNLFKRYTLFDVETLLNKTFRNKRNENLYQFLSLFALSGNKDKISEVSTQFDLEMALKNTKNFAKYLGTPYESVYIDSNYVVSPNKSEQNKARWEIGKLFDLERKDNGNNNVVKNFYNHHNDRLYVSSNLPSWSRGSLPKNTFVPKQYLGSKPLDLEVQKAYFFMYNKLTSEFRSMPLTLGNQSIAIRFVKRIVEWMKSTNYIGGQKRFDYYQNIPKYKYIPFNRVVEIVKCNQNKFNEILPPSASQWCGVSKKTVQYSQEEFDLSKGTDYMSFVNTFSFMDTLTYAFHNEKMGDIKTKFNNTLDSLLVYLWYLAI